jgi:phosphate transport system substrate-binding protein
MMKTMTHSKRLGFQPHTLLYSTPACLFTLLTLVVTLSGCGGRRTGQTPTTDDLHGNITVSGAYALYPLMLRWADAFSQLHPGVVIDVSAGGSGKGITDVLANQVDLGMVSREMKAAELQRGALPVAVARDAVVPVINVGNPLFRQLLSKGLSQTVARDIWVTGRVKTWGQVAATANATPINVYTRSDACGAAETFAAWLHSHQEDLLGPGVYGDPGIARQVANDVDGIGMSNISYAYDERTGRPNPGLAVIPIDVNNNGTIDSEERFYDTKDKLISAIRDGRYPSPPARELFVVTKGKPQSALVKAFLNFILADGQRENESAGYISIHSTRKSPQKY